jgi:hypothetical protein
MSRTKIERETTITYNEYDDNAMVWSASPSVIKRLQKMGFQGDARGAKEGRWFEVPKALVLIRKKNKERKKLSPEAKAKMEERLKLARAARVSV